MGDLANSITSPITGIAAKVLVEVVSESLARLVASSREALCAAIISGDLDRIGRTLEAGASPVWDNGGALGLAVRTGHYHVIRYFAKPDAWLPQSLLEEIILRTDLDTVRHLVAGGVSFMDECGRCPLLQVAIDQCLFWGEAGPPVEIVELILETRPNLEGILIRVPGGLFNGPHSWLRCEGVGGLRIELSCRDDFGYQERVANLVTAVVSCGIAGDGPAEFLRNLVMLDSPVFLNPAHLAEWFEEARKSGSEAVLVPVVEHFSEKAKIGKTDVWAALRTSPDALFALLPKNALFRGALAERILHEACSDADEERVCSIIRLNRGHNFDIYPAILRTRGELWRALRIAKSLVELGDDINGLRQLSVDGAPLEDDCGWDTGTRIGKACRIKRNGYVDLMCEMMSQDSPSFADDILGKESPLKLKSDGRRIFKGAACKFLSTCAAAAFYLGTPPEQRRILRSLVDQGVKNIDSRRTRTMRLKDLLVEYNQAFDGLRGVRDLMQGFAHTVLLPLLAHNVKGPRNLPRLSNNEIEIVNERLRAVAFQALFEGRSLLEISRLNRAWHRVVKRHPVSAREGVKWYPIIPESQLSGDYTICALTTPGGLIMEGHILGNCLVTGLYATSCLLGRAAILSLRRSGRPVATITIEPDPEGGEWLITEYQGANHTALTGDLLNQVHIFRQKLESGEIPVGTQGLGQTLQSIEASRQAKVSRLERKLGLNLERYPTEALAFYSHAVHYKREGKEVPLLRQFDFESYKARLMKILHDPLGGRD